MKRLVLVVVAVTGCELPVAVPMVDATAFHETDSTDTVTDLTPPHPIHAFWWSREPSPLIEAAWDSAVARWEYKLVPPVDAIHEFTDEDTCHDIAEITPRVEKLTVIIYERERPNRSPAAIVCAVGAAGAIWLPQEWWTDRDSTDLADMARTLTHEIGHALGLGEDDHWWDRVVRADSEIEEFGTVTDTTWLYYDDPALASVLVELTEGYWQGDRIPLGPDGVHWHWCLAPPIRCSKPSENGCRKIEWGGDIMGLTGSVTRLALGALDPSLWTAAHAAADPYGHPESALDRGWWQSRLRSCPRPR